MSRVNYLFLLLMTFALYAAPGPATISIVASGVSYALKNQFLMFGSYYRCIVSDNNMGQLYIVNNDGSNLTQITDIKDSFIQASVSKDGKTIVTQRNWETDTYEYGHIVSLLVE